jgi:hypothetical protein
MADESLDHPFDKITAEADILIASTKATIFQKFTCSGCGQRLTMDVPNTFYTHGTCDKCGVTTDIKAQGCNFLMIAGVLK